MLHSLTLVPHPPLLLRELSGAADVVPDLRASVTAALLTATAGADAVLVVGGGERTVPSDPDEWFDPGRYAPALRPVPPPIGPPTRPVSIEVPVRGLLEAGWDGLTTLVTIGEHAGQAEARAMVAATEGPRRVALVVAADGSARRNPKAPGHFDPRAVEMDGVIDTALLSCNPDPILALTPAEAAELWIPGRAGLYVLAMGLQARAWRAPVVHYLGDPFGVRYRVLTWTGAAHA